MAQMHGGNIFVSSRVIISALTITALGGWGAFAYSALSTAEMKKQLLGQAASIREYQAQYLSARKQVENLTANLKQAHTRLSSAHNDINRISEERAKVETELADIQTRLEMLQQAYQANGGEARTALIQVTPRPTQRDVIAAQEVLTELRYGSLKADGVVGPETRRAIKEYQHATGLPITGELHAETLQALLHAGKFMAAQKEYNQKTF